MNSAVEPLNSNVAAANVNNAGRNFDFLRQKIDVQDSKTRRFCAAMKSGYL